MPLSMTPRTTKDTQTKHSPAAPPKASEDTFNGDRPLFRLAGVLSTRKTV